MNSSSNELHVIFGTGPIGAGVMRELHKHGKRVRMVNRSGKPSAQTGTVEGVEFRSADAYEVNSAREAAKGATHVYQCAQPEYHEWVEKFPPFQRNIMNAAIAADAKFVVMENLYMYGDTQGQPMREGLPYRPHTRKGKVRAEMAEEWQTLTAQGKLRATSGRASDFYGPGYMVMGEQQIYPLLAGKSVSAIGSLEQPHTFSYTEDVGKALAILGQHDEALGSAWHIPSGEPITQRALLTLLAQAAGQPAKFGTINGLMMRMAGLFSPGAKEMIEMMYEFTQPFILDSSKFQKTFGMQPTPYADGAQATIAWFKAHPAHK